MYRGETAETGKELPGKCELSNTQSSLGQNTVKFQPPPNMEGLWAMFRKFSRCHRGAKLSQWQLETNFLSKDYFRLTKEVLIPQKQTDPEANLPTLYTSLERETTKCGVNNLILIISSIQQEKTNKTCKKAEKGD